MPAKAGIHLRFRAIQKKLDSRLRGNDKIRPEFYAR